MKKPIVRKLALMAIVILSISSTVADPNSESVAPNDALNRLKSGNERFAASKVSSAKPVAERRVATAKEQHPFAIIVGCADARTAPEIIFDQDIGDLFVV